MQDTGDDFPLYPAQQAIYQESSMSCHRAHTYYATRNANGDVIGFYKGEGVQKQNMNMTSGEMYSPLKTAAATL